MTRVQVSRTVNAPAGEVWQALTSSTALRQWFWPEQAFGTVARTDVRVGGEFRIEGPRAGIAMSDRYVRLDRPDALGFTWCWNDEKRESLVTIELTAAPGGTDIVVTHQDLADETEGAADVQGWSDCLSRLPAWLAGP